MTHRSSHRPAGSSSCVICHETKRVQVGPEMAGLMDAYLPRQRRFRRLRWVFSLSAVRPAPETTQKFPWGERKLRGAVLERSRALGGGSTVTPTPVRPPSSYRLSANGVRGDRAFVQQEHAVDLTARGGRKLLLLVLAAFVWYGRISGTVRRAFRSLQGG